MKTKLAVLLAAACWGCGRAAPAADPGTTLRQLLSTAAEEGLRTSIGAQLRAGRVIERLPQGDLAEKEATATLARSLLQGLAGIPRERLSESDLVSAELLEWVLDGAFESPKYHWLSLASITPYQSPLTNDLLFLGRDMPIGTAVERERLAARLTDIGPLVDSIRVGLEIRASKGIRVPRPEVDQILGTLRALQTPGLGSPYAPAAARIASVPDSARPAFEAAVTTAVDQSINPALGRLIDYLAGDYLAAAPTTVGLAQYPGGEAYYRFLVAQNTTLDRRPEDIHQTGLAYLAQLEHSMDSLLAVIGFTGTRREFQAAMARDPRLLARTPEEVGARYQKYYEAIKPHLGTLFLREPKAPAEFRRLNPRLEAASTYGFYQPPSPASPVGIYFYNASNLKERSLASVGTIAFHELVPGHHFQIALALENDSLPPFRREFNANAFAEGWAEYASSLAGELGMYSDPYDAYGRLISEAFLTTRLVVDPGMNLLGWSRDSAMAFMRAHTMMAESEIRSETLRYAVDLPGQALGYKVGAMEFHRLRRHAAEALGDRFDVRAFHALVLDAGSLPMTVVERMVDRWIERVRSGG